MFPHLNFAFLVAHPFPDVRLSVALLDLLYHITLFSFQGAGLPADRAGIKDYTSSPQEYRGVVEINGIEPLTPCLQSRCSTS